MAQQTSQTDVEIRTVMEEVCEEMYDKVDIVTETLCNRFEEINTKISKIPLLLANPTTKGLLGEITLLKFLKEHLDSVSYTIENVAKKSNTGDCIVSHKKFQCICDSKSYSKNVPSTEVEKLKNDMITQHIRCGILVSFTSGIAKHKNIDIDMFYDTEHNLCCLMVIGNAVENSERIILAIHYLESFWENILNNKDISTPQEFGEVWNSSNEVMNLIQSFLDNKKRIDDSLLAFQSNLTNTITMHVSLLRSKLK